MVCKEDVCAWFKGLSCAKRLDLMCGLLHMCLPLEKRFLGTFLEDQCRTDYISLRAEENKSNDPMELKKMSKNICLTQNRCKISVILSLMYSSNTICSNIMFELLTSVQQVLQSLKVDSNLMEDFLLILTMAVHHPAFSFSQRCELADVLHRLQLKLEQSQESEDNVHHLEYSSSSNSSSSSPGSSVHTLQSHSQTNRVHVKNIELMKGSQKRVTERKTMFQLQVTWSDGSKGQIYKTYQEFSSFHADLIKLFPNDSGAHKQERHIPFLCQEKGHSSDEIYEFMGKYVEKLSAVPEHILQCDHMKNFFQSHQIQPACNKNQSSRHQNNKGDVILSPHSTFQNNNKKNQTSPSSFKDRDSNQSSTQSSPAHMIRSQIIYNSHFEPEGKKLAKHENSPGGQRSPRSPHIPVHSINNPVHSNRHVYIPGSSPLSSPLASPMSSPYISPASSQYGGSRPGSPTAFSITAWLKRVRLHKYAKNFAKYTIQDFLKLKDEDLENEGLTKGAQKRFRTEIDNIKQKMSINGNLIWESQRPKSPVTLMTIPGCSQNVNMPPTRALFLHHQHSNASSREASPSSCSDEYSSPADSPLPRQEGEIYSPRINVSDNSTYIDNKMSKMNFIHGSNGNAFRRPSVGSGDVDNGVQNNLINQFGIHNVSMQTPMVSPIRPMSYTVPPGVMLPRQAFYRSPRQPLIRADGTPGYMLPRIPNGVGPMVPPPPIVPPSNNQVTVHDPSMAVTTTSVSYAISQGTMTSPVQNNATGMFHPTTVVPTTIVAPNTARPNTLDLQQQVQSSGIQTSAITVNGPGTVQVDSNASSNNKASGIIAPPQIPGILNIAPIVTSSSSSSELNSGLSSTVFHSTTNVTMASTTASTVVSYSLTSFPTVASPSPVMNAVGIPPIPPSTQSSPTPTPAATGLIQTQPPQSAIVMPPPSTVPTPVQQHHSACESPCSECNCSKQLITTSLQQQHQPPANNTNSTFTPHSYQQIWPHPMLPHTFLGFHGSNGLVNPAGISNFGQAQTVHSYGVPAHHHPPPNGISPEVLLQNHMIINQALAAQQHFWNSHMQHYTGGYHYPGGKTKTFNCYNCGQHGHKASDCPEPTMEAITNQGTYHLNLKPRETLE